MPSVCVVQINVTDMDRAIEFYCSILGFELQSREHYPQVVVLKSASIPLILFKVEKPANINYPHNAQTLINISTDDLEASLRDLKLKGVELLHETPQLCPVGVYAAFKDPFGNVHELLELRSAP